MPLCRRLTSRPRPARRSRPDRPSRLGTLLASLRSPGATGPQPPAPSAVVPAVPAPVAVPMPPPDPARVAEQLYHRWTETSGHLYTTAAGDTARRDLVEHLLQHPRLLITAPVWRDRLVEVTVARATQVLLPPSYEPRESVAFDRGLTDAVRDMLRGETTIAGAEIPAGISGPFLVAVRLLERYDRACTYEETPLGATDPDRGLTEFPDSDESIEAENELLEFLACHPELTGTREFADWS